MADQVCHRRPLVFAHRGGSGLAPENTIAAFENGLALGSDGIELDVHLSADGEAVVIHDPTIDRTTDGRGAVAGMTADELVRYDAGHSFACNGGFPWRGRGCRIPRLRDVLRRFTKPVLIELKTAEAALPAVVAREVAEAAADERVLIGSFHEAALAAMRGCAPHLRRGADRSAILAVANGDTTVAPAMAGVHSFHVPDVFGGHRIVTPAFVRRAHDLGVPVYVWTIDTDEDVDRLLNWGVDGIITDRPDVTVGAVGRWWAACEGRTDR